MRSSRTRTIVGMVALIAAALVWGLQAISTPDAKSQAAPSTSSNAPAAPTSSAPTSHAPTSNKGPTTSELAGELASLLAQVKVSSTSDHAGYERDCGQDQGCVFGPAWTDDYDGPGGHDGCDTRNNVLRRDLTDIRYRSGTHDCVAISGQLQDPYTGAAITFEKATASKVQIDHIYPLSAAWNRGASSWPLVKRIQFANDIGRNLMAVDGSANASKGDRTPGEWMPINGAYRCEYLARFLRVAVAYDLPISPADRESVQVGGQECP